MDGDGKSLEPEKQRGHLYVQLAPAPALVAATLAEKGNFKGPTMEAAAADCE